MVKKVYKIVTPKGKTFYFSSKSDYEHARDQYRLIWGKSSRKKK